MIRLLPILLIFTLSITSSLRAAPADDDSTKKSSGGILPSKPQAGPSERGQDALATHDASDAVASLDVHPDLEVQIFASEPMITSPSSIDIDARGRVWVCDVVNYRRNAGKRPDGDQILVLEDTDGDAKADKKTFFYQGHDVDSAHGICVLGDQVIISCGDEVFSLFDRDGDLVADADSKQVMFTNIGGAQHDHGIHAFHFGPDGRLYFNFGNAGKQLCDPEGKLITDINGIKCTNENNRPYQEGMVFRCDLDGKNVELLAWNFRNNWEVAVDSFGTVWQSDNDDDGNKAVPINYVMEYGNFGYKDEMTGAGWREPRIGMSEEIPERHWHQNDPGVVPNLLITGAGSPTGLVVYEGDLLPEIFHGQLIHCDAGPNVVRSYITEPDGAGYKVTKTIDLIRSTKDHWFRPSDVCVAPDGSLFVADWYDPGVGGHAMGDVEKGRIFRVIPKNSDAAKSYRPPTLDLRNQTGEGIVTLLQNPNESARFHGDDNARQILNGAVPALMDAFKSEANPRHRARYLWNAGWIDVEQAFTALEDPNPNIRITALRTIRHPMATFEDAVLEAIEKLDDDPNPQVRRECALALRFFDNGKADHLWAKLAHSYKPEDRWMLEALGIGADLHWDSRFAAFMPDDFIGAEKDYVTRITEILHRSRSGQAVRLKGMNLMLDSLYITDQQFLRSLDFCNNSEEVDYALKLTFNLGKPTPALYAAGKLGPDVISQLKGGPARLEALLAPIRGTAEFVQLAERLNLRGFEDELANYIAANATTGEAVTAARLLLANRKQLLGYLHDHDHVARAEAIITALGKTGERSLEDLLTNELTNAETPATLKPAIINAMAGNGRAGQKLLDLATAADSPLDESQKNTAALAFARSPDQNLREAAARRLPVPKAAGAEDFPPLAELVKLKGDAKKGAALFATATCNTCHKVAGEGTDFGPDLSGIGAKLGRDALFEAILYPSAAVSHGFHGISVTTQAGNSLIGYVTGETDTELQLRLPGGVDRSISKKDIDKQAPLEASLMPPGLAAIVGAEGLADVVSYLQTLR